MLTVYFDCEKCGLRKQAVQVPAREHAEVDVVRWFERTLDFIRTEHAKLSPHCRPKSLQNIMIPASDRAEFIGQQEE